jgi:ParB family chromosome partitioning protein
MVKKDFTEQAKSDFHIPKTRDKKTTKKGIRPGTKSLKKALARIVDIDRVKPDPEQVRKKFDEESLNELASSISEKGIIQPLIVEYEESSDNFRIILGERRYRAASIAGLTEVPCIIHDNDNNLNKDERLLQQLTENIQREDLDPVDQAYAIKRLIDLTGITQEEAGEKIGKSQQYVAGSLKIINGLPDVIKNDYRNLTREHLLRLARLKDDDKKIELYEKIKNNGMPIKELREAVNEALNQPPKTKKYRSNFSKQDYKISITFNKKDVKKTELIKALREWLKNLENGEV